MLNRKGIIQRLSTFSIVTGLLGGFSVTSALASVEWPGKDRGRKVKRGIFEAST